MGNPSGLFLLGGQDPNDPDDYQQTPIDILRHVFFANVPPLVLTIAYCLWNSHLTVMLAAVEYEEYATPITTTESGGITQAKHGLRVSHPVKGTKQRSTHFSPYRSNTGSRTTFFRQHYTGSHLKQSSSLAPMFWTTGWKLHDFRSLRSVTRYLE